MLFDLTGHTALVTGGNGGIGQAYARGLLRSGASVAIWGRNEDKNARALEELRLISPNVHAFACDVADPDATNIAFAKTQEALGAIHSCFANAGGAGHQGSFAKTTNEQWEDGWAMNVGSVINTYRPFVRALMEQELPGKLIVTSSIAATIGTGFAASYATTKAAVMGLTRALAVELGPAGITANALLPGYVESDLTASQDESFTKMALRRSTIQRLGTVEDMEGIAVFLASRHSDYMNGQGIIMDGGHTIFPA